MKKEQFSTQIKNKKIIKNSQFKMYKSCKIAKKSLMRLIVENINALRR